MIPLLLTIIFFSLFGMVHGLRTRELNEIDESKRYQLNRKWHKLQAAMHVIFAVMVANTIFIDERNNYFLSGTHNNLDIFRPCTQFNNGATVVLSREFGHERLV